MHVRPGDWRVRGEATSQPSHPALRICPPENQSGTTACATTPHHSKLEGSRKERARAGAWHPDVTHNAGPGLKGNKLVHRRDQHQDGRAGSAHKPKSGIRLLAGLLLFV